MLFTFGRLPTISDCSIAVRRCCYSNPSFGPLYFGSSRDTAVLDLIEEPFDKISGAVHPNAYAAVLDLNPLGANA